MNDIIIKRAVVQTLQLLNCYFTLFLARTKTMILENLRRYLNWTGNIFLVVHYSVWCTCVYMLSYEKLFVSYSLSFRGYLPAQLYNLEIYRKQSKSFLFQSLSCKLTVHWETFASKDTISIF